VAYQLPLPDWRSDVCTSDPPHLATHDQAAAHATYASVERRLGDVKRRIGEP
jgi:hypothetical protein